MVTDATAGICIIFSMFFFPSVRPEMFGGPRRKGKAHAMVEFATSIGGHFAKKILLSSCNSPARGYDAFIKWGETLFKAHVNRQKASGHFAKSEGQHLPYVRPTFLFPAVQIQTK